MPKKKGGSKKGKKGAADKAALNKATEAMRGIDLDAAGERRVDDVQHGDRVVPAVAQVVDVKQLVMYLAKDLP